MTGSHYYRLFEALSLKEIKYLVAGGLAVNLYGISRMTADIDFLISFDKVNLEKLDLCMKSLDYSPLLPISILELADDSLRVKIFHEKNLIVYSYHGTKVGYLQVDMLNLPDLNFGEQK